ncbi:hypothetical protein L198_02544 [Cryptococcus wingfieldii CBS 7118]|uniref:Uncharacterized protein n=1 Tax=Cryptococcus wingfieldii CBS 7118 TaxID=1295528 RepID=A0A1E3JNW2_9TREE|nr:hypothetical protein L198_02544 [Cryptococcus wingfieldii CBS 7118]ODO01817.1 hypothetical protein L198_02544 [Cryptococcus wingfieldii CBS 7118]
MSLFPRQIDSSTIPSACSDQCQSAMSIYSSCSSSPVDTSGCLKVCEQSTFNDFVACMDCTVDEGGVTGTYVLQLMDAVDQLKEACRQTGQPVTGGIAGSTNTGSGTTRTQISGPGTYSGVYNSSAAGANTAKAAAGSSGAGSAIVSGATAAASDGSAAATSSAAAAATDESSSSSAAPLVQLGTGLFSGILALGAGVGAMSVL